jgi:cyclopropane-fatty-acyl-phospholipid synthase
MRAQISAPGRSERAPYVFVMRALVEWARPTLQASQRHRFWWDRIAEQTVSGIFSAAGISVGETLQVRDPRFFRRVLIEGSLGLGESYVDGWWECDSLDVVIAALLRSGERGMLERSVGSLVEMRQSLLARAFNRQSVARARRDVSAHYDNDDLLFAAMLDRRMIYSCAYWKSANTLDDAQEAKLELVCRKLELRPGMRLLDLGCGWGGFARYAAERFGVHVVGVTVSKGQATAAERMCAGLPIEIRAADYREVRGKFDRIVSIGMLEHVGYKNYSLFMHSMHRCLEKEGLALVQVIGGLKSTTYIDPWMSRHIFPNAVLPSVAQIGTALEPLFVLEDWHNFGVDYDRTLLAWNANLERSWPQLGADLLTRRRWRYYLLSCAGSFRARHTQLWQIVLSPRGVSGGYRSIR